MLGNCPFRLKSIMINCTRIHFSLLFLKAVLLIFLLNLFHLSLTAQSDTTEPDPNAFVMLENEPQPINMNEVVAMIGYPLEAKEKGITGKVIVRILIDEEGKYVKHLIVKKEDTILNEAVELKIHHLKFTPAIQGEKAIRTWVSIPFNFKLTQNTQTDSSTPSPNLGPELAKEGIYSTNYEEVVAEMGYPKSLQKNGIQGKVGVRISVDRQGNYVGHQIQYGREPKLIKLVEKHLFKLKFLPDLEGPAIRLSFEHFSFLADD